MSDSDTISTPRTARASARASARIAFLSVRIPAAEKDLYSHLAAEANLNLTDFIRQALRTHAAEICGGIGARNRLMRKVQQKKETEEEAGARARSEI